MEISLHNHPLSEYMPDIADGDWKEVAGFMLSSADKLSEAGAALKYAMDKTNQSS